MGGIVSGIIGGGMSGGGGGGGPTAPPPLNYGQEAGQYLFGMDYNNTGGFADPRFQQDVLASERMFQPQYTGLSLENINSWMQGLEGGRVNPEIAALEEELAGLRKDLVDGPGKTRFTSRYKRKHPNKYRDKVAEINEKIAAAEEKLSSAPGTLDKVPGLFEMQRQAAQEAGITQRSEQALQQAADVGALDQYGRQITDAYRTADPYSAELADLGSERAKSLIGAERSEAEQLLGRRGLEFAASTGELSPLEQRRATQSAREASTARGRGMDQSALYGEMQSRMAEEMNKQEREIAIGSQLLGQQSGMEQQRFGQEQAALGSAYGMQRGMAGDIGSMLFGRPSTSQAYGGQMLGSGLQQAGGPQGPSIFDPNTGINLALAQRGQDIDFMGAQAAQQGAQAGAESDMMGSVISAGASIKVAMLCIPEGETVTTDDGEKSIDEIVPGDIVTGYNGEQTTVIQKHIYKEDPEAVRFVRFTLEDGKTFAVCDKHRVEGKHAEEYTVGSRVGGSEIISLAVFGGVNISYDLLTEDAGYQMQGVPVNSMIEELSFLTKHALSWGKTKSLLKLIISKLIDTKK